MTKNNYVLACVPVTLVNVLWRIVEPFIKLVVDVANNEITADSIKQRCLKGDAMLVCVCKEDQVIAVNLLEVRVFETGLKALYIPVVGGTEMDHWCEQFLQLANAIAKDLNCTELRGLAARHGWVKKLKPLGWEEGNITMYCKVV